MVNEIFSEALEGKKKIVEGAISHVASNSFLDLMLWGRKVLLQDIPLMHLPEDFFIFKLHPFNTREYHEWSQRMNNYITKEAPVNKSDLLNKVLPQVSAELNAMHNIVKSNKELLESLLHQKNCSVEESTCNVNEVEMECNFGMKRNIVSLREIWQEWTVGIDGKPSVQELDAKYGTKWRQKACDRKLYSNRKCLITEIKRRAANNSIDQAINVLEDLRCDSYTGRKSMEWLRKHIVEKDVAEGRRKKRKIDTT